MNHARIFPFRRPSWRTGYVPVWVICTVILVFNCHDSALAQLSPGPLSRPHAHLEGLRKCSNCHKLGSRDVGGKCLDCHEEIAAMRQGGPGMHAADDFSACVDCHVEHQGEDYELIYWPDGREGFDHRSMGFEKAGAHAKLDCRQCHFAKYVVDPGSLKAQKKDLGRTYLGLDSACTSCHDDVHVAGNVADAAARTCTECHDTNAWRPAPGFAHDKTVFPLTGKHQAVDCAKCHVPNTEGPVHVFAGLKHETCTDCHRDPHAGALGADCRQCHSTEGWLLIQGASFDHSKTRYPLVGRHASVTCAGCHAQDRKKPRFDTCTACHGDAHNSAGLARPRLMECEKCHTVDGFRPARYPLEKHAGSSFPLKGAHQATACDACHRPLGKGAYPRAVDLAPAHDACTSCHADPHLGHADKYMVESGCLSCHDDNGWRAVTFAHEKTGFVLEGRHQTAACLKCHPAAESGIGFRRLANQCAGCHEDVHRGQFADKPACDACHVTVDWLAEKFDHDTDSRFALKGGHERVACTACHRPLEAGNDRLLHFKPLPVSCKDCHANDTSGEGKTP